ncbi:hypothetical protein [Pseudonocardia acaciae]|uniref:hypothetical protein n=1 Tax=Pseudonocardia acaciae TaxID=551276 RepID=UPI0012ECF471|nr:hypothetical protein [Pseudonocardia acaciae]
MLTRRVVTGAATAAALALVLTGLGSAVAAPAFAEPHPDNERFLVTATVDGRLKPAPEMPEAGGIRTDFLKQGQYVRISCQQVGKEAYGSKIWDLVAFDGSELFVPDRYLKTGTDGSLSKPCTAEDLRRANV